MEEKSFEENMTELELIVENLEKGDINLDDAIEEFQKAMTLIKSCDSKLKEAETTIAKIVDENKEVVDFKIEWKNWYEEEMILWLDIALDVEKK